MIGCGIVILLFLGLVVYYLQIALLFPFRLGMLHNKLLCITVRQT